jgi:hypothetical protein
VSPPAGRRLPWRHSDRADRVLARRGSLSSSPSSSRRTRRGATTAMPRLRSYARRARGRCSWCKTTVSRSASPWRTAYPQLPRKQGWRTGPLRSRSSPEAAHERCGGRRNRPPGCRALLGESSRAAARSEEAVQLVRRPSDVGPSAPRAAPPLPSPAAEPAGQRSPA